MKTPGFCFFLLILFSFGSVAQVIKDYNGYLPVKIHGEYGLIDTKGNLVLQPQYENIYPANDYKYYKIKENQRFGYIDTNFNLVVKPEWNETKFIDQDYILTRKNSNFYVYKTENQRVVNVGDSVAAVKVLDKDLFAVNRSGYWNVINFSGEVIIKDSLDNVNNLFDLLNIEKNGKFGLFSKNGKEMMPPQNSSIYQINGLAIIYCRNAKYGIADTSGIILTEAVWDNYSRLGNCIRVKKESFEGLFSIKNKKFFIKPDKYESIRFFDDNHFAAVSKSGLGLLNLNGEVLVPPEYTEITVMEDFIRVSKGGTYGFYNKSGRLIVPCKHTQLARDENFMIAKDDDKYTVYSFSGAEIYKGYADEIICTNNSIKVYIDSTVVITQINETGDISDKETFENVGRIKVRKWDDSNLNNIFNFISNQGITINTDFARRDGPWFYVDSLKKWGLMDKNDSVLIKPSYASIYRNLLDDSLTIVQKKATKKSIINNNFGIINEVSGKFKIPLRITDIWIEDFDKQQYARCMMSNYKFRILWESGTLDHVNYTFIDNGATYPTRVNEGGRSSLSYYVDYSKLGINKYYQDISDKITGGKWGYIDSTGYMIIRPVYLEAGSFSNGVAIVGGENGKGMISKDTSLTSLIYNDVIRAKNSGDSLFYLKVNNRQFGLANEQGTYIKDCQFTFIDTIAEGLIRFQSESYYGFLDEQGNTVIEPIFRKAGNFSGGLALVQETNKIGYIDQNGGLVIPFQFKKAGDFHYGRAWVRNQNGYSYIDEEGELITEENFTRCNDFKGNYAKVIRKGKMGMINCYGKMTIGFKYPKLDDFNKDGIARFIWKGKEGLIDTTGSVIVPLKYKDIGYFNNGLAYFSKGHRFGFINKDKKVIIKPEYRMVKDFNQGLAAVKIGRVWGFIDTLGQIVINPEYHYVHDFHKGLAIVESEKYGAINKSGKAIIPLMFDYIDIYQDSLYFCKNGNDYHVYTYYGRLKFIIKDVKEIVQVKGNTIIVRSGYSTYAALDMNNNSVFNPNYSSLENIGNGLVKFRLTCLYGIADLNGNIIEEPVHEAIDYMGNRIFRISKGDRFGYLNTSSQWLWKPSN